MRRKNIGITNGNFRNGYYLDLRNAPAIEVKPVEKIACVVCGQEVEARPMKSNTCYSCYRDGLDAEVKTDNAIFASGLEHDGAETGISQDIIISASTLGDGHDDSDYTSWGEGF